MLTNKVPSSGVLLVNIAESNQNLADAPHRKETPNTGNFTMSSTSPVRSECVPEDNTI
jgi:hypothetical protein